MNDDNVMPNNSGYFVPQEPKDQVIERKKERANALEVKKELEQIIDRFDKRIGATDSIQKALELGRKYEISQENALIVMDIVRQQLEDEKAEITDLLEIHASD